MQSRLVAFFLPVLVVVAAVLGGLLAAESARRITLDAALARDETLERIEPAIAPLVADETIDTPTVEAAGIDDRPSEPWTLLSNTVAPDLLVVAIDGAERTPEHSAVPAPRSVVGGDTIWPWTDGVTVTERSFVVDGRLVEVSLVQSTNATRRAVTRWWLILGAAIATVVALIAAGTYPLARWALRPVRELDDTARTLATGDLSARASVGAGAPELRQLAESFNVMAHQLAAGIHRERAFVASASHHFGNLLTPLRLRVESIDRSDPMVDEALAELDRLESVAERLLELNLAEEAESRPVVVDVGAIVDETIRSWRAVTNSSGIELRRRGSTRASAWAVPGALDESLDNLIDNSVKYADGSPITVTLVRGLHNVRVTVADGGPGMDDGEIEQAQGRFWRGPTQQSKPGSGLGLAIVDALAVRSGGHFEMRTGPGGGLESTIVVKRALTPDEKMNP